VDAVCGPTISSRRFDAKFIAPLLVLDQASNAIFDSGVTNFREPSRRGRLLPGGAV